MYRVLMVALAVFAFACKGKDEKYFEVNGNIKGGVKMVYLEELPIGLMQKNVVDSAGVAEDGSFSLKARTKEESAYGINFGTDLYPVVINDVKKLSIEIDPGSTSNLYTVKGSPSSESLREFFYSSNDKLYAIYSKNYEFDSLRKTGGSDSMLTAVLRSRNLIEEQFKHQVKTLLEKSESPALSMYVLGYLQSLVAESRLMLSGYKKEEIVAMVKSINDKFPQHEGVAAVYKRISTPEKAPEFSLPDINGTPVSLASFKGKYVLVDFWASWCKPCRQENPNIVRTYNKYKEKNFTILGVSLDQTREAWVRAIAQDSLNWTHVSDLKEWSSTVVPLYNIQSIPFNVLVDPQGNIIATGLRGYQLEEKLREVLK